MKQSLNLSLFAALLFSAGVYANGFKTVGQAKWYLFWDVYNAKLETPSGSYQFGQHPANLHLLICGISMLKTSSKQPTSNGNI